MADDAHKIVILYATQTGNAQDVAERIAREGARRHFRLSVASVANWNPAQLPYEDTVILVTSTTGQGDAPDSMIGFWKFLLRKSLGHRWLEGLQYAVFGLGDSGYQDYNVTAKKLDKRLLDLGAKAIIPRGLGDDQHPSGYEAALDPWLAALWAAMRERFPLPLGLTDPGPEDVGSLDPPKFSVKYHKARAGSQLPDMPADTNAGILDRWTEYEKACKMMCYAGGGAPVGEHTATQPVFAELVVNKRLTAEDHFQDVRHLEFDLGDTGLQYEPGDILNVVPSQDGKAIDAFLRRCNLQGDALISVEAADGENDLHSGSDRLTPKKGAVVRLRSLVEAVMDVSSASPRRYTFEVMSHFATAEHEKERLKYFATAEGRDDLYQYNQRERRSFLEVLEDFPSVQLPLEWLLQLVPHLKSRAFSISSSLRLHPNRVHLTVAVVEWVTPFKRRRHGLCSKWLSQLDPTKGTVFVPCWISRGALKLPPPSVPLILVGPGTGCAPFKAFVEDRCALAASSQPVAPILLFFGCRNHDKDFLYRHVWQSCSKAGGVLSKESGGGLAVAFSRDQERKVYVQDKIEELGRQVWDVLQAGGSIFVAGSATKMPTDVGKAVEKVVAQATGWPLASASRWLKELHRCGRYHVEAWS